MNTFPILIVDDMESLLLVSEKQLKMKGYSVDKAMDGGAALAAYKKHPYPIVVTDLNMPNMDGFALIQELKKINPEILIIVTTSESDLTTVIKVMRQGVYDYLIKPINYDELLLKVGKLVELYELRLAKETLEEEKMIRMEKQIEWNLWKESLLDRSSSKYYEDLFYNLNTSISQGNGFGALTPIVEMIVNFAEKDGEYYKVDSSTMDLARNALQLSQKVIDIFSSIHTILKEDLQFEKISPTDLHKIFEDCIKEELREIVSLGNHTIKLGENKNLPGKLNIHRESFRNLVKEVLTNACKFSKKNTDIIVLFTQDKDIFKISIMNDLIIQNNILGIPKEYENLVFEPFIRLAKYTFDDYKTPDFGLGLLLVQKTMEKHRGKAKIFNISFFLGPQKTTRVNLDLELPIA